MNVEINKINERFNGKHFFFTSSLALNNEILQDSA